jgi:DNA-binding response OmpR family regulator
VSVGDSQDQSSPTWTAYCSCVPVLGATEPILALDSSPMKEPLARALVVDDDAALRLLCRVNLELEGFAVREAATVAEAEAALAAERPDVVLLDVHLRGEQTHDLLARIRADGIPVALVTGSVDMSDYRDSADAMLAKPFVPQMLVETARRLARVAR